MSLPIGVVPGQMTLGSLRALVCEASDDGIPDDAPIFWYFGDNTFTLQAEPKDGRNTPAYPLLTIEVKIAQGGPA